MIEITNQVTIEEFLKQVLPYAYRAGLHKVPAKFATDMFLLLHSMTTALISDLLFNYLNRQNSAIEKQLTQFKEEIWLSAFLHDILKEANVRGERLDHQDIRPDDVNVWLTRLNIRLKTTTPMRLAARIAMHERGGLPLFSAFANVEQDDLPQLVIRLSDQLASISSINEHWHYEGHGLPSLTDTLNGRGRLKGINQRLQSLGVAENLRLFSHYHTQLTYPYLTNQLLAGTVASIRPLGPEPLLVLTDGVIYICKQTEYETLCDHAMDLSEHGLGTSILHDTWERLINAFDQSPLRPEDIRSTQNGMKIFAQMRLVGTPLVGDTGLFNTISTYLSQRVTTKSFASLSTPKKKLRVAKFIADTVKLIGAMPKYYEAVLQTSAKKLPRLRNQSLSVEFAELAKYIAYTPDLLQARVEKLSDPTALAKELSKFGSAFDTFVRDANPITFERDLKLSARTTFEPVLRSLLNQGVVVADMPIQLITNDLRLGDRYCPMCGQQSFSTKLSGKAVIQQRETFFPIAVKSHTNSGSSTEVDGTRVTCKTCALEFGLRGMGFSPEAYKNKQSVLQLHLLPFFSFPMNWIDAMQQQFGFRRGDLRTQLSEATLQMVYANLFAASDKADDWERISKIANPLRTMKDAFFATDGIANSRDEFFGTPSIDVAGSVTLSVYARRNERKPGGKDLEDEIGRKEMWARGVMLASLLAEALPIRVVVSESPLINFDPTVITSSLTLINPPEVITNILARVRQTLPKGSRYKAGENEVSRVELQAFLKTLIFALRVNKTLGGAAIAKDGREYSKRPSRRVVEIIQALADETLVGSWLHQRDWQSRPKEYLPNWFNTDYQTFTQACLEVDKMLDPQRADRLRQLALITQTFYSPPVYDSSHALTLPFKVATKTLQKFVGTRITTDELKTIMRSDIESAVRRQTDIEGSKAWIVLKRPKKRRQPDDLSVSVQLTDGVRAFANAFLDDIVYSLCGDITNFLILRKRLQSGYLIQMKDLALTTWEREGRNMFKKSEASQRNQTTDEFSLPA